MFQSIKPVTKEKAIKESNICIFSMRHTASAECYGKGTNAKSMSTAPVCVGGLVKDLHELLANESTSVNAMEYEKE
jgi:hypothetical protein